MGAYESWVYTLRCPQCARTGAAKEVELDGWSCMRACQAGAMTSRRSSARTAASKQRPGKSWAGDAVDQARWG
jgi:hypothetical protein